MIEDDLPHPNWIEFRLWDQDPDADPTAYARDHALGWIPAPANDARWTDDVLIDWSQVPTEPPVPRGVVAALADLLVADLLRCPPGSV